MTITKTIEVPADRRVYFEFLAPQEIPEGKAKIEMKLIPVIERQDKPAPKSADEEETSPVDALFGILSGLGDITLEQIRDERLAKHLKHLK